MTIERTKNASRNMVFGMILKIYQIIVPFLMRTAMIYFMGVEYLGLNSLFISILQVLNLAELGVGAAMVYSMYKPIAENDETRICALLKLYKTYYRVIGLVVCLIGLIITPFIPKLIVGKIPQGINIYVLFLLNLVATVLSYWLFAYKISLLQAHQRVDVVSKVNLISSTIQYVLQLVVLWRFHNYYLYIIILLFSQAMNNIITAVISNKMYPNYQPSGSLEENEKKVLNGKIRDLCTAKIGTVFGISVDNVVISSFLGLTMLAIYQNYYYIMNAIIGIINTIFVSVTAGVGNSLVLESPEKNYNDFKKLTFIMNWICIVCIGCFVSLYQPFMLFWVGKDLLLPDLMVVFICFYFYVSVMQNLSCLYKDAAGIWRKDRFRPLVAGIVNLILNVLLVKVCGIYAIVLSTIISYVFIAMPWVIHNLFSLVFKRKPTEYIIEIIKGVIYSIIIGTVCYYTCLKISVLGIGGLLIRFVISFLISNICLIIFRRKCDMYRPAVELVDNITRHKFSAVLSKLK